MAELDAASRRLEFKDSELANKLFGPQAGNLALLADKTGVLIDTRGSAATLSGPAEAVDLAASVLTQLYGLLQEGKSVHPQDVDCAWRILLREPGSDIRRIFQDTVYVASPRKTIAPKTISQRDYLSAIRENDLVFAIGPAGTGKTYLAVALAVSALMKREVKRIVLARPAVEAGEKLGFLPGDLAEKVNPYLRPLHDALFDILGTEKVGRMMERNIIEIAPLAFMRGRTLNEAFVILDEAQNTTSEQMKMFLTRIGFGSKAVITGDVTQIDLPQGKVSGLKEADRVLVNVPSIRFIRFDQRDVVRHPIVQAIVNAYDAFEKSRPVPDQFGRTRAASEES